MIDAPTMREFIKGLSDMGAMALPFLAMWVATICPGSSLTPYAR